MAAKAEAAANTAAEKPGVESLSDLPGSVTNPEEDEAHAMTSVSSQDLAQSMLDLDPKSIEDKLSRVL